MVFIEFYIYNFFRTANGIYLVNWLGQVRSVGLEIQNDNSVTLYRTRGSMSGVYTRLHLIFIAPILNDLDL